MALLNEITQMQQEGRTDAEIINELKAQGIPAREITEALSQSRIKEAVTGGQEEYQTSSQPIQSGNNLPIPGQQETGIPTIEAPIQEQQMQNPNGYQTQEEYAQSQMQQQYPQDQGGYPQQAYQEQQEYAQYPQDQGSYPQQYAQPPISTDTITEISEQIVTEKLSPLKTDIEKVIDMKTTLDSKLSSFDERLKRIEKIIDRLQLSIMQKVGDYMSNIEDIKKEIQETQKSFKFMSSQDSKPRAESKPKITKKEE